MEEIHNENPGEKVSQNKKYSSQETTIVILTVLLLLTTVILFVKLIEKTETEYNTDIILLDSLTLQDSVMNHLFQIRIEHPYIVQAQAILESGNFTSKLFKENHNHFGMKLAKARPTTAIGVKNGYAVYRSWQDCDIDYALWQATYARKLSEEEYYTLLQKSYAEDFLYITKLKKIFNE